MIKKILVPTDGSKGSENAIQMAVELAKNHDAELYILYVVPKGEIPKKVVDYLQEERIDGGLGKLSTKVIGETVLEPILKKVNSQGSQGCKMDGLTRGPGPGNPEICQKPKSGHDRHGQERTRRNQGAASRQCLPEGLQPCGVRLRHCKIG